MHLQNEKMIKKYLREILLWLPFRVSKNLEYDRLTRKIIRKVCREASNCIDVGCHKGEVMNVMIESAPMGSHLAFEPIPELAERLIKKYKKKNVSVFSSALSNYNGLSSFNLVVSNPAYSGLKRRSYDRPELDKRIEIEVASLDDFIKESVKIDLIKIDVEGGELDVMKGAKHMLERDHPVIIFEHGKGGAEHYESGPDQMYEFLNGIGYRIFCLDDFLSNGRPLNPIEFIQHFEKGTEYYFVSTL